MSTEKNKSTTLRLRIYVLFSGLTEDYKQIWLDCMTHSREINLGKLGEMASDREALCAVVHGVTKSQT